MSSKKAKLSALLWLLDKFNMFSLTTLLKIPTSLTNYYICPERAIINTTLERQNLRGVNLFSNDLQVGIRANNLDWMEVQLPFHEVALQWKYLQAMNLKWTEKKTS